MELGVREWIVIIGALVVVAVLLDGYRSLRNDRSGKLRMSRRKLKDSQDADGDPYNPELPESSVRVVPRHSSARPAGSDSLQLDKGVPVLMDPLDEELPEETPAAAAREGGEHRPDAGGSAAAAEPGAAPERRQAASASTGAPKKKEKEAGAGGRKADEPRELIVLNVVAGEGKNLRGSDLLQILLACDVRFGKMNIFHRYEDKGGSGAEQFSVVNMVEPGTFDLDNIEEFSTPGVSFFMSLPGPKRAMEAFDCMAETARCLAKNLGAELHDEAHSVATAQTLEHYRQRIRDFERRQLTLV